MRFMPYKIASVIIHCFYKSVTNFLRVLMLFSLLSSA